MVDSAYTQYSRSFVRADSMVALLTSITNMWLANGNEHSYVTALSNLVNPSDETRDRSQRTILASASIFLTSSVALGNAVGDLSAIVPPPDLAAIHPQLLETMRIIERAFKATKTSLLALAACYQLAAEGAGCNTNSAVVTHTQEMAVALVGVSAGTQQYTVSRARIAAMLAERGVSIPAFAGSSTP